MKVPPRSCLRTQHPYWRIYSEQSSALEIQWINIFDLIYPLDHGESLCDSKINLIITKIILHVLVMKQLDIDVSPPVCYHTITYRITTWLKQSYEV